MLLYRRNVIGSALADNISLRREDLIAIAVLSVTLEKEKSSEVNTAEGDVSNRDEEMYGGDTLHSRIQRHSLRSESFDASMSIPTASIRDSSPQSPSSAGHFKFPEMLLCGTCGRDDMCSCTNLTLSPGSRKLVGIRGISNMSIGRPVSKTSQFSFQEMGRVVQTVRVDSSDMNPLKPCGNIHSLFYFIFLGLVFNNT